MRPSFWRRFRLALAVVVILVSLHSRVYSCSLAKPLWAKDKRSDTPMWVTMESPSKGLERFGFIDSQGIVVVPPTFTALFYSDISDFFEGLARVGVGKWFDDRRFGYINHTGTIEIPLQFVEAGDFSDGLAWVSPEERRWGYIDRSGTLVMEPEFDQGDSFNEGRALVKKEELWGYIDKTGELVIPTKFFVAREFSEGLAAVVREGKPCVVIDDSACSSGTITYPKSAKGEYPLPACQFSFIDRFGKQVFPEQFEDARPFSEGLAPVALWAKNRKNDEVILIGTQGVWRDWGYINQKGEVVIPIQFRGAGPFVDGMAWVDVVQGGSPSVKGMARVGVDTKYGYIDPDGNYLIEPRFDDARDFSDGLALVGEGFFDERVYWYIDRYGQRAFEGEYKEATTFHLGRAHVELITPDGTPRTWAYIDETGKIVFSYTGKEEY